jgi:hypothetical protein
MNDRIQAVEGDLAFLKAVAQDRGPLPVVMGWHLVAIGAIFAIAFIHIWAVGIGLAPWPAQYRWLLWLPGVLAYVPVNIVINARAGHQIAGPTGRTFGASWAAIALMVPPAVLVLVIGQMRTGHPFYLVWPSLIFYAGAWIIVAMVRRTGWHAGVAVGCIATALTCASLIGSNLQWLVLAAAFALFVGTPGAAIALLGRRRG